MKYSPVAYFLFVFSSVNSTSVYLKHNSNFYTTERTSINLRGQH